MFRTVHIALEVWASFFCLFTAIVVSISKNHQWALKKNMAALLYFGAIVLMADAMAWYFRGDMSTLGYYMVRISNFLVFMMEWTILTGYTLFIWAQIQTLKNTSMPIRMKLIFGLCGIGSILVIMTQFTGFCYGFDAENYYHRGSGFMVLQSTGIIGMFLLFTIVLQYRRFFITGVFKAALCYMILPGIALVVQSFIYGIAFLNFAIAVSMLCMFLVTYIDQNRRINAMQIDILRAQMGEHFIFNCLNTIKSICVINPDEAGEIIDEFSIYLRENMETISMEECVNFTWELEHVKHYLQLEKRRFGDRIHVVYDIKEQNFQIPAQTLQPLIENAVKHGICKKAAGGTIVIQTEKSNHQYIVTIHDDGVGYNIEEIEADEKKHIGIKNVGERLLIMCDGKLEMSSVPGQGTTARIYIKENRRG